MASNILKTVGFVLILGAVAAGAYHFGKSSGPAKPQGAQAGGDAQPGVAQRVQEWVGGTATPGAETPAEPAPGTVTPESRTTTPKPAPAATRSSPKPAATAPVSVTVGDAVPTTVTALAGDLVLTGAKAKVRLLGVNTPANGTDGTRARDALAKLLGDGAVKIQLTSDRTAAVVWKDGRRINESMVRLGWSRSDLYPVAEAEAKRNRDGLWSPEGWMGP